MPPACCTCLGRRTDPTESIWQCRCRSVRIHRPIVLWTWTLDLGHCTLHIAPCTLTLHLALAPLGVQAAGRLARWGYSNWGRATCCSGESMRTEHCSLFFCSLVSRLFPPRLNTPIPGRPEISQGERTPRTHDRQMPPDRIKLPPELSNNGGELGPRLSCSSASRLSSRLSPDGP